MFKAYARFDLGERFLLDAFKSFWKYDGGHDGEVSIVPNNAPIDWLIVTDQWILCKFKWVHCKTSAEQAIEHIRANGKQRIGAALKEVNQFGHFLKGEIPIGSLDAISNFPLILVEHASLQRK